PVQPQFDDLSSAQLIAVTQRQVQRQLEPVIRCVLKRNIKRDAANVQPELVIRLNFPSLPFQFWNALLNEVLPVGNHRFWCSWFRSPDELLTAQFFKQVDTKRKNLVLVFGFPFKVAINA